ncbi:MAG: hypothetical protein ABI196_04330 [Bradyrhizobium sp.]
MAKQSVVRLLEVAVTASKPTLWRWRVSEDDEEIAHGFEKTRETAQIEGDDALFRLLSMGQ